MTRIVGWALGVFVSMAAATAQSATIDTSRYAGSTTLLDASGPVFFDGAGDFFAATDAAGDLFVDSFLVTDPLDASLDFVDLPSIIAGASSVSIMEEAVQFLFELGGLGYLVTIDATGQGLDFTDETAFIYTTAQITLEELTFIPLPASLPLMIAGVGAMALLRRRVLITPSRRV